MKHTKQMAVFIDHTKARFIGMENGKATFLRIVESGKESHPRYHGESSNQSRFGSDPYHGSNNEYSKNMQEQENTKMYFHQLKNQLQQYDEIVLFGPGQAKKELHNYLIDQSAFREKTIHVHNSDYITDNQLLEMVNKFFNTQEFKTN
jgi:hypothetical protein